MPLAVHRSAPSSNMRPPTQRSTSMPGSYPYPYAYLYTYDTLLNNSLGMSSSISGASSSPRRRRVRALGTLGLNDNDDGGDGGVRRTGTRRAVSSSSRSLLTRAYASSPMRPRCSVSDGSTAARQVLAEIEWWRVVQGQCDTEPNDLDIEEEEDDQQIDSGPRIDVLDGIADGDAPVYSPSIPPVTRIRSHAHAHAHDDFTFTPHSFSAVHSRTSSSSSSDSELDIPGRIPRGIVPFPSAGFDLNNPATGAPIFPPAPVSMMDYDRDEVAGGGLNGIESVPMSGSSAIVKAALAALFPTSSSSTPPTESTPSPSPPSQLLALSLSSSFSHQDANGVGVGIYTPALPQTSRVRSISLPEASSAGNCGMAAKHTRFAAEAGDYSIFGETVRNL